jgi:toxin ParE1/3/4
MPQVHKSPQAHLDSIELADFIARHSFNAASRFLDQLEQTLKLLAQNPEYGQLCQFKASAAAGMRVWQVDGFPNHLVFYRAVHDGVHVVRVLHGARDLDSVFGP